MSNQYSEMGTELRGEYHDNRSTQVCLQRKYSSDSTAINFMAIVVWDKIRSLKLIFYKAVE
jgi:hypothetical protein